MIADSTEALLGVLKWVLLGLLYLFFARVLWAVWSEVRQATPGSAAAGAAPAKTAPPQPPTFEPTAGPAPVITVNRDATHAATPPPVTQPASSGSLASLVDPTEPALHVPVPAELEPSAAGFDAPTRRSRRKAARAADNRPKAPKGKRGTIGRLVVLQPRAIKGSAFAIGTELSIGRGPGNGVALTDDTFASQLHARVYVSAGGFWVEDLGSTNGTFLNGRRIMAAEQLTAGDRLQVGNTIFEAQ